MHTVLASIKNIFVIGQCAFYVKCGIVVVNGMELLTWFLIWRSPVVMIWFGSDGSTNRNVAKV